MPVSNWDEIRTAFHVARAGTVSGAAEALGVHHATVIRHVDALEAALGVKLFQRHARGYTPTEAGADLLRVGQATDDQFAQFASRVKGQGDRVEGDLVVTSLTSLSPRLTPILVGFRAAHPGITLRYVTGRRILRLEYGEAHVAIRAGAAPEDPDNVVQPFRSLCTTLYASEDYVARRGRPETLEALAGHDLVGSDEPNPRPPFLRWLAREMPADAVVFRASDPDVMRDAVAAGAGIGFVSVSEAERVGGLVRLFEPRDDWSVALWLVTHVDLHRTTKVQTFLRHLKDNAPEIW